MTSFEHDHSHQQRQAFSDPDDDSQLLAIILNAHRAQNLTSLDSRLLNRALLVLDPDFLKLHSHSLSKVLLHAQDSKHPLPLYLCQSLVNIRFFEDSLRQALKDHGPLFRAVYLGGALKHPQAQSLLTLTQLERLARKTAKPPDSEIAQYTHFQHLKWLKLSFTKGLGVAAWRALKNVAKLEDLTLHFVKEMSIDGLIEFCQQRALASWSLQNCQAINDSALQAILNSSSLRQLTLLSCPEINLRGIAGFASQTKLESLSLHNVALPPSTIPEISAMTKLKTLHLGYLKDIADQDFKDFGQLKGLEELTLMNIPEVSELTAKALGQLPKLTKLTLDGCPKLSNRDLEDIAKVTQLTTLTLKDCDITGFGLQHLRACRQLKTLTIRDCRRVKEGSVKKLEKHFAGRLTIKLLRY